MCLSILLIIWCRGYWVSCCSLWNGWVSRKANLQSAPWLHHEGWCQLYISAYSCCWWEGCHWKAINRSQTWSSWATWRIKIRQLALHSGQWGAGLWRCHIGFSHGCWMGISRGLKKWGILLSVSLVMVVVVGNFFLFTIPYSEGQIEGFINCLRVGMFIS